MADRDRPASTHETQAPAVSAAGRPGLSLSVARMAALQRGVGNAAVAAVLAPRRGPVDVGNGIRARAGAGQPLADGHRQDLEGALGADLSRVRVHADAEADVLARSLSARAVTAGSDIFLASSAPRGDGPEARRLLAHEATHAVQQAEGPVAGGPPVAGVSVSDPGDRFEAEARSVGDAVSGAPAVARAERAAPAPAPSSGPLAVQRDLGFELETQALVDHAGRPIPEKTELGTYGAHLTLTVDENPAFATPTLSAPWTAHPAGTYHETISDTVGDAGVASGAAGVDTAALQRVMALRARWDRLPGPYWRLDDPADANDGVALDEGELVEHLGLADATEIVLHPEWVRSNDITFRRRADFEPFDADRVVALEGLDAVTTGFDLDFDWQLTSSVRPVHFHDPATGQHHSREDLAAGAGIAVGDVDAAVAQERLLSDEYASILEIVTDHHPPETAAGQLALRDGIAEAKALADLLTGFLPARQKLGDIAGVVPKDPEYHVGNPARPGQNADASIQATFGIDLAQLPAYITSSILGGPGGQVNYKLKHHSDVVGADAGGVHDEGDRVAEEMRLAIENADAVMATLAFADDAKDLRGLLVLVAQYLRLGRHFHDAAGTGGLDKNVVALMSRTDLHAIRTGLKAMDDMLAGTFADDIVDGLLAETGRRRDSSLTTNLAETVVSGRTCQEFLDGVFSGPDDTLTAGLGAIKMMGPENIDPGGRDKQGPVFELRNVVPKASGRGGVDRFIPATWRAFAETQIVLLGTLNVRPETEQGPVPLGPARAGPAAGAAAGPPMPRVAPPPGGLSFTEQIKSREARRLRPTETTVTDVSGEKRVENRPAAVEEPEPVEEPVVPAPVDAGEIQPAPIPGPEPPGPEAEDAPANANVPQPAVDPAAVVAAPAPAPAPDPAAERRAAAATHARAAGVLRERLSAIQASRQALGRGRAPAKVHGLLGKLIDAFAKLVRDFEAGTLTAKHALDMGALWTGFERQALQAFLGGADVEAHRALGARVELAHRVGMRMAGF